MDRNIPNTDPVQGLSSAEARQRLLHDGYNEFEKTRHTTLFQKFISQFKSFMIIVLIVAAVISGVTGYINGEGVTDALIIGMLQESKAEKSLDALEKMSAPHCKVIRDGVMSVIESRELVVGDIVSVETGDSVPADLRLLESVNLKVQVACTALLIFAMGVSLGSREDFFRELAAMGWEALVLSVLPIVGSTICVYFLTERFLPKKEKRRHDRHRR